MLARLFCLCPDKWRQQNRSKGINILVIVIPFKDAIIRVCYGEMTKFWCLTNIKNVDFKVHSIVNFLRLFITTCSQFQYGFIKTRWNLPAVFSEKEGKFWDLGFEVYDDSFIKSCWVFYQTVKAWFYARDLTSFVIIWISLPSVIPSWIPICHESLALYKLFRYLT